ncbi:MAG: hypothetical protein JNJ60_16595 [Rhodocyclaceae bacterium]|nr:hypothetical protein [Rhodocyclaceae bacterium]
MTAGALRALAALFALAASAQAAAELPATANLPGAAALPAPQFVTRTGAMPVVERIATLVLRSETPDDGWVDVFECDSTPDANARVAAPAAARYRALQAIPPLAGPGLAPRTPAPACRAGQWRAFAAPAAAELQFEYGPLAAQPAGRLPLALVVRIKYGASGLRAAAVQSALPPGVEFTTGAEEFSLRTAYTGQFTLRLRFEAAR